MTRSVLAVAVFAAALLQVGLVPAFVFRPVAAPLLPLALLAGWGVVRGVEEVWPALPVAALTLAAASTERSGWFLLAVLPTAALLLMLPPAASALRRAVDTAAVAAASCVAYLVVLLTVAGQASALASTAGAIGIAAAGTAGVATCLTLVLQPQRGRAHGLFS